MRIILTKRAEDFHCHLEGSLETWSCGKTVPEAVCTFLQRHGREVGLVLKVGSHFDERPWNLETDVPGLSPSNCDLLAPPAVDTRKHPHDYVIIQDKGFGDLEKILHTNEDLDYIQMLHKVEELRKRRDGHGYTMLKQEPQAQKV
jgi:hypothetical protein